MKLQTNDFSGAPWAFSINTHCYKGFGAGCARSPAQGTGRGAVGQGLPRQKRLRLWVAAWSPFHRLEDFQKEEESRTNGRSLHSHHLLSDSIQGRTFPKRWNGRRAGAGGRVMSSSTLEVFKQKLVAPWRIEGNPVSCRKKITGNCWLVWLHFCSPQWLWEFLPFKL